MVNIPIQYQCSNKLKIDCNWLVFNLSFMYFFYNNRRVLIMLVKDIWYSEQFSVCFYMMEYVPQYKVLGTRKSSQTCVKLKL